MMLHMSAGDRLDRSINKLKEIRDEKLSSLNYDEKMKLEPYRKQLQMLKDLMGE